MQGQQMGFDKVNLALAGERDFLNMTLTILKSTYTYPFLQRIAKVYEAPVIFAHTYLYLIEVERTGNWNLKYLHVIA